MADWQIGDRVRTPFTDEVLTIVDRRDHYHLGAHEVDYQTSDGEWHYDGWYFTKADNDE
jgi:hypothetical protein